MAVYNKKFMKRALELAKKADGRVQPNPYVGAVVVKDNKIIGEGYHKKFGGKHAEPIAIDNAGESCEGADLYVNLEPCSHMGKTPPCVDKIIRKKIKRVFIGISDPHKNVKGDGILKLKQAGIDVYVNILREKAIEINRKFLTHLEKKRPYILLKYAMTLDGYIATVSGDSQWISNEKCRRIVHQKRHNYQGILVGSSTVLYDNPRLSARNREKGFQPKPYILDMVGEIDNLDYNVFNRKAVLITPSDIYDERGMVKIYRFDKKKDDLKDFILEVFEKGKLHSLMIEGGAKTLSFFMENGLFDEVNVFISPKFIGEGVNPLKFNGIYKIKDAIEMKNIEHKSVGEDFMLKGFRENVYWID